MANKVVLEITVNDNNSGNDLGIGIRTTRDGHQIDYSDLTINELRKIDTVFRIFVKHEEDMMTKEQIAKSKHLLRAGTKHTEDALVSIDTKKAAKRDNIVEKSR